MSNKGNNAIGSIFTILWMGWVYAVEDMLYTMEKSRGDNDKLKVRKTREMKVYKDVTYPIWRRALAKARIKVLSQRIPKKTLAMKNQRKLTEFME